MIAAAAGMYSLCIALIYKKPNKSKNHKRILFIVSFFNKTSTVSSLKIRHIKKLIYSASPNFDIFLESNYHKTTSCRNN